MSQKKILLAPARKHKLHEEGKGYQVFSVFNTAFLVLAIICAFYPIYFVLAASFSSAKGLAANYGLLLLPIRPLSLTAYELVFRNPLVLSGYGNTFIILFVGVSINLVLTLIGAYVISLKGALLSRPLALLMLFTMYFSGGMIPSYINIKSFGLMDTLWALIIPGAISTYNLLIMRSAFAALPDSMYEAAYLDGASHLRILTQIYIPLSSATIAVLALYYAVGHWNSWFNASLYISTTSKYPLQLVLRQILILNENSELNATMTDNGEQALYADLVKYALIVVSMIPVLIIYPFVQKHFVKGVTIGAVKG